MATLQIDGEWQTLKLGRKKERSISLSENPRFGNTKVFDYLSPSHRLASWAVPVADSRTSVKTDEGDANVSEQVSSPATAIKNAVSATVQGGSPTKETPDYPVGKSAGDLP